MVSTVPDTPCFEIAVDAQYYAPIAEGRDIRSLFVDVAIGIELLRAIHLTTYAGLTTTHAWGSNAGEGLSLGFTWALQ